MANHRSPADAKKFTIIAFVAFVTVFVFAMIMMVWHGDVGHNENGERHYNTQVYEPQGIRLVIPTFTPMLEIERLPVPTPLKVAL